MWWMMKAMIRCKEYLDTLDGYYMIMQVHDELVFDFPRKDDMGNLPIVRKVQKLMEKSGDDFGIPTPVGIEYHPDNWAKGLAV
jgi:DNA polymerase I-like protein with 3'-5' exonuclease and polymerase domains